jgi:hypothetical protein
MFLGGQLKLEERRPVETLEKDEKPRKWWILFVMFMRMGMRLGEWRCKDTFRVWRK